MFQKQKSRNIRFGFSSVHTPLQLSNLFLQDLEKFRDFTARLKAI